MDFVMILSYAKDPIQTGCKGISKRVAWRSFANLNYDFPSRSIIMAENREKGAGSLVTQHGEAGSGVPGGKELLTFDVTFARVKVI
jgi:hypothetical protein